MQKTALDHQGLFDEPEFALDQIDSLLADDSAGVFDQKGLGQQGAGPARTFSGDIEAVMPALRLREYPGKFRFFQLQGAFRLGYRLFQGGRQAAGPAQFGDHRVQIKRGAEIA